MSRLLPLYAALLPQVPHQAYWTPERILDAFRTFRRHYRRWPRRRELVARHRLPSAKTFYDRFHSLAEAQRLAAGGTDAPLSD